MFAEMQPLYWRIQNTDASGFDAVSLLMPSSDGEPATLFPTDVSFCSRRSGTQSVDLQWSDDDSDLFMTLLDRVEIPESDEDDEGLVLDIAGSQHRSRKRRYSGYASKAVASLQTWDNSSFT